MRQLVALDLPGGPAFVDELERAWSQGDAAFPVDQRLPAAAKADLYARFGVATVVGTDRGRTESPGAAPVERGDALVVATSGSTGTPKGVVLTHDAVAASAAATSDRLEVGGDDHWLACLPLSHVGGLSVVTRALHTGVRLTILPGFEVDAVEHCGASLVSLVSTAVRRIDASLFRIIVLGGSRPLADRPANAVTTYGMTETGSGVVYDRRPLDGVDVRIVDGEVQLRGPMLLRCYRDGSDPRTADGWFPTGDLGELDPAGLLTVHGRRDELIISGGENVWPEPIEAVLSARPDVADVAIIGVPDPEWGQLVTALVVPVDPDAPPSLDSLRDSVKATMPGFCAPRAVTICDYLPRTSLGKLHRHELPNSAE